MKISDEVHGMKNTLMAILFALESDASEEHKIKARNAVMNVSDKLTEIEAHVKELQGEKFPCGHYVPEGYKTCPMCKALERATGILEGDKP